MPGAPNGEDEAPLTVASQCRLSNTPPDHQISDGPSNALRSRDRTMGQHREGTEGGQEQAGRDSKDSWRTIGKSVRVGPAAETDDS